MNSGWPLCYTTTRENGELRLDASTAYQEALLYHYERKRGTTTTELRDKEVLVLYHYERKRGTTTPQACEER
mgnify:CR=1 FL=1